MLAAEIPRTTVRIFILEGKLHSKWCHSSLESSFFIQDGSASFFCHPSA
ncbi:hypothetical protein [Wolbachia endosymbiont of Aedes albopictus]|nr:hypothetical protein [Wolbachia endosymbiont of Aedes albopictus]UVW84341.1 hypothetical protein NHG98_02455 [Wolbachia endosymbiont of Aedes albopictus]